MPALDPRPSDAMAFRRLDRAFASAVGRATEEATEGTVLLSGGVDSTLLARSLLDRLDLDAVAIGPDGGAELAAAASAAEWLGVRIRLVRIGAAEVSAVIDDRRLGLADLDEPQRSVQVALGLAFRGAERRVVFVGQGADELFGGYAHFRGLSAGGSEVRRRIDLDRLRSRDWPFTRTFAGRLGRELRAPFLDDEFVGEAIGLPIERTPPGELTKGLFRRWAIHRGIPRAIAERPKRAIQYGTRVALWLDRRDRRIGPSAGPSA
ncbi:MAG TPA: asparagine synthase C-terminal domain-containing protein [Thermoplasmata archaeon]|nr:asparagine synthase C-terminal domain-containing protein [Thermoplasmata archaeon]